MVQPAHADSMRLPAAHGEDVQVAAAETVHRWR